MMYDAVQRLLIGSLIAAPSGPLHSFIGAASVLATAAVGAENPATGLTEVA